jgi:hypothetical protein
MSDATTKTTAGSAARVDRSTIHFHSGDPRACRKNGKPRRFSPNDNDVTCAACKANDTLTLSAQGIATLAISRGGVDGMLGEAREIVAGCDWPEAVDLLARIDAHLKAGAR